MTVVSTRLSAEMKNHGPGAVTALTSVTRRAYLRAHHGLSLIGNPRCQPGVSNTYRSTATNTASQGSAHG
jgi:hypothetical protein